jgi:response regulator NasT
VGDGQQAVDLAKELQPDLVILDIQMPVLDGLSAAEQIASARIAPVIVLTAFSQRELVERARDAGAMAYLVKPFSKNDLVPAIEVARGRFAEMTALDGEVRTLEERLEARKIVEKAKGRLMEQQGITEAEAFRWIQRTAMNQRTSMKALAQSILEPDAAVEDTSA